MMELLEMIREVWQKSKNVQNSGVSKVIMKPIKTVP